MPPAAIGQKRKCLSCAAPFFDMAKDPIVCPKCGARFEVIELPRSPPRRQSWNTKRPDFTAHTATLSENAPVEAAAEADGEPDAVEPSADDPESQGENK